MKIEVGQVWRVKGRLVMVSSVVPGGAMIGKAVKKGSSYAIVESPNLISGQRLRRGTFVFDTEAASEDSVSKAPKPHLRGQGSLVRSQFQSNPKQGPAIPQKKAVTRAQCRKAKTLIKQIVVNELGGSTLPEEVSGVLFSALAQAYRVIGKMEQISNK